MIWDDNIKKAPDIPVGVGHAVIGVGDDYLSL